jgi:hypothetical protein
LPRGGSRPEILLLASAEVHHPNAHVSFQEAIQNLMCSLTRDNAGAYYIRRQNVLVRIRLRGKTIPYVFTRRDNVCFRVDEGGVSIEALTSGAVQRRFLWQQVESLSAGQREADNSPLFQG